MRGKYVAACPSQPLGWGKNARISKKAITAWM